MAIMKFVSTVVALVCLLVIVVPANQNQVVTATILNEAKTTADSNYDKHQDKNRLEAMESRNSAVPLLYDRWNRESNTNHRESIRDNEISGSEGVEKLGSLNDYKSQQDYVCGRAVANKKFKDILLRDANYQMSVARAKYRPIEIRMPRIIGGDDTSPGEFPWTVSIKLNGQPICGGSLIDKTWILTAAHCVVGYNPKNLTVRLGAYRIKDASETQTKDLPVSMFVVHKDYSMPRPFSNDIAMMKLVETVDYTDYIIPICLPTEDQITTTQAGSVTVNDYSNIRESPYKSGEDIGGIVISTKMSDHEIAKCFNRLEQNYLSSIGLGAIADVATTGGSTEAQHSPAHSASPSPMKHVGASPAILMMSEPLPTDSSSGSASGHNNNNNYKPGSKLSFPVVKPIVGQTLSSTSIVLPKPAAINDHHLEPTFDLSQASPLDYGYDDLYFGSPWNSRGHYGRNPQVAASSEAARLELPAPPAVKLSRLPINKELLREIQSIGSEQMPSLDLGLQAADFVAMAANELNKQTPPAGQTTTTTTAASYQSPSNNKARFKMNDSHHASNIVRAISGAGDNDENDITTVDDPTKYSGLSGTVVGWGWIRELDGEDQVNNKGYPSVTLQKVKLPILRNHVCEAWFQSQSKKITLLPSQFCAGFNSGGKDACRVSFSVLCNLKFPLRKII